MVQKSPSPNPRGRPRTFDPADALKAASERFRTRGYAGTSLDDLVDATGLARPSLYAAFGDKRALYLAALDRTIDRVGRSFDALVASDLPLRESLTAMFRFVVDGFLTGEAGPSGCIMITTSATGAVEDAAVRERLATFLAIEDDRVEALLADRGDAKAHAHARLVTAVVHSLSVRARAGATREELDAIAAACITLIA